MLDAVTLVIPLVMVVLVMEKGDIVATYLLFNCVIDQMLNHAI